MSAEAVAEIVKGFDKPDIQALCAGLPSQKQRDILALADVAGRGMELVMTRDVLTVRSDKPVRDVIKLLHTMAHNEGRPSQIYVVDHRGLLCGMIDLHLLLLAPEPDKPIETIMKECALRILHTADPLAAAGLAKRMGSRMLALTNVVGSTLSREADDILYTRAGPEIAVASTKAYLTMLVGEYLLALAIGRERGVIGAGQAGES